MEPSPLPYLICTTHRSGSFVFCEALASTGLAGRPTEYFLPEFREECYKKWGATSSEDYLDKLVTETSSANRVFGIKMMSEYFRDVLGELRSLFDLEETPSDELAVLERVFPAVKFIWLVRTSKVHQAVSYLRAWQSQAWASDQEPRKDPEYSFELIDAILSKLVVQEADWKEFFAAHAIDPCVVVYEDFVTRQAKTVERVLEFLGIHAEKDVVLGPSVARKQADGISQEWVRRFLREKAAATKWNPNAPWTTPRPSRGR